MRNDVPVPVIVVERPGQLLHLVDSDGEADEDEDECCRIQPMIVSVQFFFAGIDGLLVGLEFLLVDDSLHGLHVFILDQILLVDLLMDEVAEQEGDGQGSPKGNDCSPDDHGRVEELVSIDAGDDDALDGPIDEDDADTRKTRVALLVGEVGQGV